ncbi:GntR family transcriptional regulator [Microbacterium sp. A94]|uniref:GntR family transcriptional regulator n=1 Tax=Microbacterium sp. A94 TaxID=3450717 RepID=UPI003F42BA11
MARPRVVSIEDVDLPSTLDEDRAKGDQIREILESLAASLGSGAAIPSDRLLSAHFGVARMTVRAEVKQLVADGVLAVRPGSGTFVAQPMPAPYRWGSSYSIATAERSGEPGSRMLEHGVRSASERVAQELQIDRGAKVLSLVRLRTLDGDPIGIERTNLPLERFPGLDAVDLSNVSLYETLSDRWGVTPVVATGSAEAVLPTAEEAELLGIEPSAPCVLVTMSSANAEGIPFEAGRSLYRGDRYSVGLSFDARRLPSTA